MKDRKWTGFFGIARHPRSRSIVAACRQRLGTARVRKHSTDVALYRIDPATLQHEVIGKVYDVHDVHQIAIWEDLVFLTDTGLNRLHVWDLGTGDLRWILEVGEERSDVNHLNALLVEKGTLLVGMNNRGRADAAIMRIPLAALTGLDAGVVDAYGIGSVVPLPGFRHTHDLECRPEGLLLCASHDGLVLSADPPGVLFTVGGWSRGLAVGEEGIWVGISQFAERGRRHSRSLSGEIVLFGHGDYQPLRRITIDGAGQVHDLILV